MSGCDHGSQVRAFTQGRCVTPYLTSLFVTLLRGTSGNNVTYSKPAVTGNTVAFE